MLEQVLTYLNNWFVRYTYTGDVTVSEDGAVLAPSEAADVLQPGRWYRILDSDFYDGVYQVPEEQSEKEEPEEEAEELEEEEQSETLSCTLWALGVPAGLMRIVAEMEAWQAKYGDAASGPYQSESFGGYSYSKAGASSSGSGTATVWTQFADALAPFRRPPMARAVSASGQSHQDAPYRRPFSTEFRR
ncbi:MAG: hypothetical protein LUD41_03470 [Phascolarctobacterium sp.]|nr:hypothetical protein [Phascolarctobacterium sp.]